MKKSTTRCLVAVMLCAILAGWFSGCAPAPKETGLITDNIAATVNGAPVMESRVTNYIEAFRNTQDNLQSSEEWAKTLANAKLTPETLRQNVIETFIEEQLIRQAAKDLGIEPNMEVINNTIENSRMIFSSEEAWLEELTRVGYASEYEYRASLEDSYLRDTLKEAVIPLPVPSMEELEQVAPEESRKYAGKRSSHILFRAEGDQNAEDVKTEAALVEKQLDEGADFAEMAALFSEDGTTSKNGGDVGWEKLNPSYGSAYTSALAALSVGEYSAPIETSFGIHIIYCTAEFKPTLNEPVDFNSIPQEVLKRISDEYALEKQNQQFRDFINQLIAESEIVIETMPEGLSYDVDISLYVPSQPSDTPSNPSDGSGDVVDDATEVPTDDTQAGTGSDVATDGNTTAEPSAGEPTTNEPSTGPPAAGGS